jgi:hypothetical protein
VPFGAGDAIVPFIECIGFGAFVFMDLGAMDFMALGAIEVFGAGDIWANATPVVIAMRATSETIFFTRTPNGK